MDSTGNHQVGNRFADRMQSEERLLQLEQQISQSVYKLETLLQKVDWLKVYASVASSSQPIERIRKSNVTFFEFMHSVIQQLTLSNRGRTAEAYESAFSSFRKFMKLRDVFLDDVDDELIRRYEMFLHHSGVSKNSSSFYMRILRAVYNRAVEKDLVETRHPYKDVYTGGDRTVKRALNMSAIKRIKNLNLAYDKKYDFARDMFLFSFYMRGMSFIDMAHLKRSNLSRGYITYRRRKTGQELHIKWEVCMQEIVDKYRKQCDEGYLLPIFKRHPETRNQYKYNLARINRHLREVALQARIHIPLTLYVARHSWARIAKSKRIPISVISECMGHDSEKTTRIYLTALDKSVIDKANKSILNEL